MPQESPTATDPESRYIGTQGDMLSLVFLGKAPIIGNFGGAARTGGGVGFQGQIYMYWVS